LPSLTLLTLPPPSLFFGLRRLGVGADATDEDGADEDEEDDASGLTGQAAFGGSVNEGSE